jgi:hypothetical protein
MTYGLGRIPEFDERSRLYSVASKLPPQAAIFPVEWECAVTLDQGQTPECVGFSIVQEIDAAPVVPLPLLGDSAAHTFYHEAQLVDEWPGTDYEGTSVLAGAKVATARGYYGEYRWAFSLDDALTALCNLGPFIMGLNWYEDMFYPDEEGILHVGGAVAGGHAILGNGLSVERGLVRLHNSWGSSWGINGEAFLTVDDFDYLRRQGGEVMIPMSRFNPGDTPVPPLPPAPAGCLPSLAKLFRRKG